MKIFFGGTKSGRVVFILILRYVVGPVSLSFEICLMSAIFFVRIQ